MDQRDSQYLGPESRRVVRRQNADRRGDIRFEPNKDDRRANAGRRSGDNNGWRRTSI